MSDKLTLFLGPCLSFVSPELSWFVFSVLMQQTEIKVNVININICITALKTNVQSTDVPLNVPEKKTTQKSNSMRVDELLANSKGNIVVLIQDCSGTNSQLFEQKHLVNECTADVIPTSVHFSLRYKIEKESDACCLFIFFNTGYFF